MHGVSELVMAWTVQIRGKENLTKLHHLRYLLTHLHGNEKPEICIQQHLVLKPTDIPLQAFTCIQELINILINIVNGEF
ncbi:hypothetical protein V8E55_005705 [Tylopilus felleus]